MSISSEIFGLFERSGASAYFGERVSMTEHSLQAAYFAREQGAPAALVVAALLHDVGHLLEDVPEDLAAWTSDAQHEEVGARWLAVRFGPEISEPVRLHVPAKRYLCATNASYLSRLSSASRRTLELQGGPMTASETARFAAERYAADAVRMREWDDQGKVAGLSTPGLAAYRTLIEECASPAR
jgi:[1-hydroxy-2-(trimethylamino)ethyl]phosphonate dioxygenase